MKPKINGGILFFLLGMLFFQFMDTMASWGTEKTIPDQMTQEIIIAQQQPAVEILKPVDVQVENNLKFEIKKEQVEEIKTINLKEVIVETEYRQEINLTNLESIEIPPINYDPPAINLYQNQTLQIT